MGGGKGGRGSAEVFTVGDGRAFDLSAENRLRVAAWHLCEERLSNLLKRKLFMLKHIVFSPSRCVKTSQSSGIVTAV